MSGARKIERLGHRDLRRKDKLPPSGQSWPPCKAIQEYGREGAWPKCGLTDIATVNELVLPMDATWVVVLKIVTRLKPRTAKPNGSLRELAT